MLTLCNATYVLTYLAVLTGGYYRGWLLMDVYKVISTQGFRDSVQNIVSQGSGEISTTLPSPSARVTLGFVTTSAVPADTPSPTTKLGLVSTSMAPLATLDPSSTHTSPSHTPIVSPTPTTTNGAVHVTSHALIVSVFIVVAVMMANAL